MTEKVATEKRILVEVELTEDDSFHPSLLGETCLFCGASNNSIEGKLKFVVWLNYGEDGIAIGRTHEICAQHHLSEKLEAQIQREVLEGLREKIENWRNPAKTPFAGDEKAEWATKGKEMMRQYILSLINSQLKSVV